MDRRNLLLVVAALLISAGLLESGARLAGLTPRGDRINQFFRANVATTWSVPDRELGWINKPGVSVSLEAGHVPMTFWDFGRRASRPDPSRPEGRTPVMVIGGSTTQGYGVEDDETFVALLAQRYPDLWFENFGNGGYSTVQSLMLAERAMKDFYTDKKPALILLAYDDSHALRNVADQSWILSISDAKGRYVAPPHYQLFGDTLIFFPFRTLGFWPLERGSAALTAVHDTWIKRRYDTAAQALPVTRRVIARLADFARENDTALATVVLEDESRTTQQLFADVSFPHIDCSGPERTDPKGYILGGAGHPNAKFHAHFADCIGPWLEKEVLRDMRHGGAIASQPVNESK